MASVPFLFTFDLLGLEEVFEVVSLLFRLSSHFSIGVLLALGILFIVGAFLEDRFGFLCLLLSLKHLGDPLVDLFSVVSFVAASTCLLVAIVLGEDFPVLFLFK